MSTKRLERTVIEGGRNGWSKWDRHRTNRQARARSRMAISRFRDGDEVLWPKKRWREKSYRGFDDNLGPAERWLRSQVNRPWVKVYAAMLETFDTRTLAGRHIVYEHLLPPRRHRSYGLEEGEWRVSRRWIFWVNRAGILCARPWGRHSVAPRSAQTTYRATVSWLAGRRVRDYGKRMYWLVPVSAEARPGQPLRFRQAGELTQAERERVARFTDAERQAYVMP